MRTLLLAVLIPSIALATAFTTQRSGNWSDTNISTTSPWVALGGHGPGGVPGNGDSITVGAFTVTCDLSPCIFGLSSTTTDLTVASGGGLIIGAGKSMVARGNMTIGDTSSYHPVNFVMGAGSTFTFDSSLSASPSTTAYTLTAGYEYQLYSQFTINGTSSSHATVTSTTANGALPGYFVVGVATPFDDALSLGWSYVDFSNISSSANVMLALSLGGDGAAGYITIFNSTFTNCGGINAAVNNADPASIIDIENNNWSSSTASIIFTTPYGGSPPTGLRKLINNVFDKQFYLEYPNGYTVTGNVFLGTGSASGGIQFWDDVDHLMPTIWSNNFLAQSSSDGTGLNGVPGAGTFGASYWYMLASSGQDSHFIQGNSYVNDVTGSVFEAGNTSAANQDGTIIANTAGAFNISSSIVTSDGSGLWGSGRILALLGAASGTGTGSASSNTYFSDPGDRTGVTMGECLSSCPPYEVANMVTAVKYNMVFGGGTTANSIAPSGDHVADTIPASVINYNNNYAGSTGTCANANGSFSCYGYNGNLFSGSTTPGPNDINVNPYMVAPTRKLLAWDAYNGGPGTETHVLAQLALLNTPSFNPVYSVANLIAWVRAGYTPQNRSVCAIDGVHDIGAIACAPLYAGVVAAQ
jgi:hypothetical protein